MVKITEMLGSSSSSESDSDDETTMNNNNNRPMCRYGAACYRKNPIHLRDFIHPAKTYPTPRPTVPSLSVEVSIEIGHKSALLPAKTREGHTHEWTVYVRGANAQRIEHYVDRVVFDVPNEQVTVNEPPFQKSHTSNGKPFTLPIKIYFKNDGQTNPVTFDYVVRFNETTSLECVRPERMVFQDPSVDFRLKLIRGGGIARPNNATRISPVCSVTTSASADSNKRQRTDSGGSTASTSRDESDLFSALCASKLRNMPPTQRIIAEKLISDVLFNGQMSKLTDNSCVCLEDSGEPDDEDPPVKEEPVDGQEDVPTQRIKPEPVDIDMDAVLNEEVVSSVGDIG